MRKSLTFLIVLILAGCGGAERESTTTAAPWAFDLPAGIEVLEPAAVPRSDRTQTIRPRLDLTVGAETDEPAFLSAGDIAVDDAGRIYLLDVGAQEIKVFESDGSLAARIGGPGEGPGELSPATPALTVAGDALVLVDSIAGRFTRWNLAGELIGTLTPGERQAVAGQAEELAGFGDGSLLVVRETRGGGGGAELRFDRFGADGGLLNDYPSVPVEYTRALVAGRPGILPVVRGRGQMATGPEGPVYLTPGGDYQVVALSVEGEPLWALRVDWEREPFPEGEVDRAFDSILGPMRAMGLEAEADHDSVENLPELLPALTSIKVDGQGRLWVFPYEYWERGRPETLGADRPVDVYSAEGERLFSGLIPASFALSAALGSPWITARGDHVYGIETDPATLEQRLVRYRLELPF